MKDRQYAENPYRLPEAPTLNNRQLIHYWNFNGGSLLTPTFTVGGAALAYTGGGAADAVNPGTTHNARNSDAAGNGLRLRNPAGVFTVAIPTFNYKDVVVSYAVQRTNNGAQIGVLSYTVDGTNFITDSIRPNITQLTTEWQVYTWDFSAIKRVNNNPNFRIRFRFNVNVTGTEGNVRFDNLAVDANIIDPNLLQPEIVHYWNFNNNSSFTTLITPTRTLTAAPGSLAYTAVWDEVAPGTALNARNNDAAGSALRLRNPAGVFTLNLPTNGYRNLRLSYSVQRTSAGAQTNTVSYSLDGTNFITTGITGNVYNPALEPEYSVVTIDFSNILAAANNPNFKVRIEFSNGNTNTTGNNRYDNIVLEGIKQ